MKRYASFFAALTVFCGLAAAQAPVTVTNPDTQPVNVKEVRIPGTQPFQYTTTIDMVDKTSGGVASGHLFVPAGKLLVIEYAALSTFCFGPSPSTAFTVDMNNPNLTGQNAPHLNLFVGKTSGNFVFGGVQGATASYGSQSLHLYASAGTTLIAMAQRETLLGTCTATINLTGHWEDVPLGNVVITPR